MGRITRGMVSQRLFTHWSETVGTTLATQYPGNELNTNDLAEWCELSVTTRQGRKQRRGAWEGFQVRLSVHVFVRPSCNLGRVQELAEQIRSAVESQILTLLDGEGNAVGFVRLRELEMRDFTESEMDVSGSGLRHLLLSCSGRAEGDSA